MRLASSFLFLFFPLFFFKYICSLTLSQYHSPALWFSSWQKVTTYTLNSANVQTANGATYFLTNDDYHYAWAGVKTPTGGSGGGPYILKFDGVDYSLFKYGGQAATQPNGDAAVDFSVDVLNAEGLAQGNGLWLAAAHGGVYTTFIHKDIEGVLTRQWYISGGSQLAFVKMRFAVIEGVIYMAGIETNRVVLTRYFANPVTFVECTSTIVFGVLVVFSLLTSALSLVPNIDVVGSHAKTAASDAVAFGINGRIFIATGCCNAAVGGITIHEAFQGVNSRNISLVTTFHTSYAVSNIEVVQTFGSTYLVVSSGGLVTARDAPLIVYEFDGSTAVLKWQYPLMGAVHVSQFIYGGQVLLFVSQQADTRGFRLESSSQLLFNSPTTGLALVTQIPTSYASTIRPFLQYVYPRGYVPHIAVFEGNSGLVTSRVTLYSWEEAFPITPDAPMPAPAPIAIREPAPLPPMDLRDPQTSPFGFAPVDYAFNSWTTTHYVTFANTIYAKDGTPTMWTGSTSAGIYFNRWNSSLGQFELISNANNLFTYGDVNANGCIGFNATSTDPKARWTGVWIACSPIGSRPAAVIRLGDDGRSFTRVHTGDFDSLMDSAFIQINPEIVFHIEALTSGSIVVRSLLTNTLTGESDMTMIIQSISMTNFLFKEVEVFSVGEHKYFVAAPTAASTNEHIVVFRFSTITEQFIPVQTFSVGSGLDVQEMIIHEFQGHVFLYFALTGVSGGRMYLWDNATGEFYYYQTFNEFARPLQSVMFVADGKLNLAVSVDYATWDGSYVNCPWYQFNGTDFVLVRHFYVRYPRGIMFFRGGAPNVGPSVAHLGIFSGVYGTAEYTPSLVLFRWNGTESTALAAINPRSRSSVTPSWKLVQTISIGASLYSLRSLQLGFKYNDRPLIYVGSANNNYIYKDNGATLDYFGTTATPRGDDRLNKISQTKFSSPTIGEVTLLAYAGYNYGVVGVYKDGRAVEWLINSASYATSMSFGKHNNATYLASMSGTAITINRFVQYYDERVGVRGIASLTFPAGTPSDVEFFNIGSDLYLIVGCCTNTAGNSIVYKYAPATEEFVPYQRLESSYLRKWIAFEIDGEPWLAGVNGFYNNARSSIDIYRWHVHPTGGQRFFRYLRIIDLETPTDTEFATINGKPSLLVACRGKPGDLYGFAKLYQWTGMTFQETKSWSTINSYGVTFFRRDVGARRNVPHIAYLSANPGGGGIYTILVNQLDGEEVIDEPPTNHLSITPANATWAIWQEINVVANSNGLATFSITPATGGADEFYLYMAKSSGYGYVRSVVLSFFAFFVCLTVVPLFS
jgi:hypothetical protein